MWGLTQITNNADSLEDQWKTKLEINEPNYCGVGHDNNHLFFKTLWMTDTTALS